MSRWNIPCEPLRKESEFACLSITSFTLQIDKRCRLCYNQQSSKGAHVHRGEYFPLQMNALAFFLECGSEALQ